ncbi:hypothetical protein GCM10027347_52700 [Larkinella harenae]
MNELVENINDLPLLGLSFVALLSGSMIQAINKKVISVQLAFAALVTGLFFGIVVGGLTFGLIDIAGYKPHKVLFSAWCGLAGYLGHVWKIVADEIGQQMWKNRNKIAKQALIYALKPLYNLYVSLTKDNQTP